MTTASSSSPESSHSLQRKAAITAGGGIDHRGAVVMVPIEDFDMGRTIFSTLEGVFPRLVMRAKIAKAVYWNDAAASQIDSAYRAAVGTHPDLDIDPALLTFMNEECDFSVEHADGTFLEHLRFCYDYGIRHYAEASPTVLLLHSILGTGTNTFAMEAEKIPQLRELLTEVEMQHVEAFPSLLRLLYDLHLLDELDANASRLSELRSITFHRVIDNAELVMDAENLWVQLNYQLVHYVDFLPVANWARHASDPLFQGFVKLHEFLEKAGKRYARVQFDLPASDQVPSGEPRTLGGWISSVLPAATAQQLAAKAVRQFSKKNGHSLDYRLEWSD